ncbi:MAG: tRNA pseudouridine(38-40) synthase TruA [Chloroflexota bacterium]
MPVRYRATVEYDGTDFAGFQVQPGKRTVQGELEAALARLGNGTGQRIDAAGRTDAGVHATGQVIMFTYAGRLTPAGLDRALGALLPADVAIGGVRRVPDGFHPRHAAAYREYRYTIWNGPPSPLRERTAFGVDEPLDIAAMARSGSVLEGRHDFRAFGTGARSTVRTVHSVRVRRRGRTVTIDVRADAFLRGMVRRIVAGLLEVGLGRMDEDGIRTALAGREPAFDGAAAPARGLCLRRVAYRPRKPAKTKSNDENEPNDENDEGHDE